MATLKSAYDLACERIVVSKYGDQQAKQKKELERLERERLNSLPDFVVAWEMKQKGIDKIQEEQVSEAPTKLFTSEEIRKHRERNNPSLPSEENQDTQDQSFIETKKVISAIEDEEDQLEENQEIDVPEVHWYGHFTSYGGFSRQNRAFAFGLSNRGARVKVDMEPIAVDINNATMKELEFLSRLTIDETAPKVYCATIPLNMNHNGKRIIYTMMESESLQRSYVDKVNLFDEVWVPTHFGKKQFQKYGVNRPIYVMPEGVDTDRYTPTEKIDPASLGFDLNKFVFLSVFKWGYRKGFDVLLKAYFDEFSSDDDVSLLLITRCENDNNPNRIVEDVGYLRSGTDKTDDEMPHIVVHTKKIPEKTLPKVYNMSDAFVLPTLGEGFCTLPDAQIKTPNGIKKISDISIGDHVFSHKGNVRSVLKTFKREYSGEMIKIKCNGRNNQTIQLTPNHNAFVLKIDDLCDTTRLKSLNNCKYNEDIDRLYFDDRDTLIGTTKYDKQDIKWIRADKIEKGDYIFYPKINYNGVQEYYYENGIIKLSKIDSFISRFIIQDDGIYKRCKNGSGISYIGQKIFDKIFINIDSGFLKLMGYFVAEGCCSKGSVMFSFNKNEEKYHEEVILLMKKTFEGINYKKHYSKFKNSCTISFYSAVAMELFESLFGKGARNKKLPNFMFNISSELKKDFLHGLLNGDGYYKNRNKISLSTASVNLANNIFDLLFSVGIKSSIKSRIINHGYGNDKTYYSVNITNFKDSNSLFDHFKNEEDKTECERNYHHIILNDNFELVRVSEIEKVNYNGYVYNIGVEIDNSYICENLAVHNCLPYVEAAACGLPVIGTNCSAQTDYLTNENSYLISPEKMVTVKSNGELSKLAKHCGFYEGQIFPYFGGESIKELRKHMREVFQNYGKAIKKSQLLTNLVHEEYSWDKAVDRVLKRINQIRRES